MGNFSANNFRIILPFLILALSMVAFQAGVSVENISNVPLKGFFMHILYSINLFAMGGVELGPPVDGPLWARTVLYMMYFLAPLVSVTAIIEAIFMSTNLRLRLRLWRGGHAVIVGAGRVGSRLPDILRRRFSDSLPLVVADSDPNLHLSKSLNASTCRIDAADPELLEHLAIPKAKCVFALTNNQWLNLGIYQAARQQKLKNIPFFLRIDAEDLMDELYRRWKEEEVEGRPGPPVRMFNVHIQAVRFLFREDENREQGLVSLYDEISGDSDRWMDGLRDSPPHVIVILGFGRFGQHFVQEFSREKNADLNRALEKVVVISKDVENELAHYMLLKTGEGTRTFTFDLSVAGKPFGSHTVQSLAEANPGKNLVWILGTDDESLNLNAAMLISRYFGQLNQESKVLIRTSNRNAATQVYHQSGDTNTLLLPSYDVIGHYFEQELRNMKV